MLEAKLLTSFTKLKGVSLICYILSLLDSHEDDRLGKDNLLPENLIGNVCPVA